MAVKKTTLNAIQFIAKLRAHNWNQSALAKELGVSRATINERAKKMQGQIDAAKKSESNAPIAVMVMREGVKQAQAETQVKVEGFAAGLENCKRQYHIFDHLEDLYEDIKALLDNVKADIEKRKEKNLSVTPLQIDQVIKLVNQSRGLITDAHDIRMKLVDAKRVEEFVAAVTAVMRTYDPDVQRKLFIELSGSGVQGQTAFFAD